MRISLEILKGDTPALPGDFARKYIRRWRYLVTLQRHWAGEFQVK
jgi:hypothetical protein